MTAAITPKGERRRQALAEAASDLLTEGGFEAVRHRAVAERAGLPLASTTYYFRSLQELVIAAVQHHTRTEIIRGRAKLTALATERRSVADIIELILDQLLGPDTGADDAANVLVRYERLVATGRRPYLAPLMREMAAELREFIFEILVKSDTTGDAYRAQQLIALVDGAVVNALIEADPNPREAARQMLRAVL